MKRKRADKPRVRDWQKIKGDYVTGEISMRDLAEQIGVSFSTLGKRAVNEKWDEERTRYRNDIATKTREKIAQQEINARVVSISLTKSVISRWQSSHEVPSASEALKAADMWQALEGSKPLEELRIILDDISKLTPDERKRRLAELVERARAKRDALAGTVGANGDAGTADAETIVSNSSAMDVATPSNARGGQAA